MIGYYLVRAFPRTFAKAFAFIPYFGTLIKFLPEIIDMVKFIHEKLKDWEHDKTKRRVKAAIQLMGSEDRDDRLRGGRDLEDTIGDRFT